MRSRALLLALFLAGCDPGAPYFGAGAFDGPSTFTYVDDHGVLKKLHEPWTESERIEDAFESLVDVKQAWPEPGGTRTIARVLHYARNEKGKSKSKVFEIWDGGRTEAFPLDVDYEFQRDVRLGDVVWSNGRPHALVSYCVDFECAHTLQIGTTVPGEAWTRIDVPAELPLDPALVVETDGTIVIWDGSQFHRRVPAGTWTPISDDDVYGIAADAVLDSSGRGVFFLGMQTTAGFSLTRARIVSDAVVAEPIATVAADFPAGLVDPTPRIAAATPESLAVLTRLCGNASGCPGVIRALMLRDGEWIVEDVASTENDTHDYDLLDAVGDPPRIANGTVRLFIHDRDAGGAWTSRHVANIGRIGDPPGNSEYGCGSGISHGSASGFFFVLVLGMLLTRRERITKFR